VRFRSSAAPRTTPLLTSPARHLSDVRFAPRNLAGPLFTVVAVSSPALGIGASTAGAGFPPARRASAIDPIQALRYE
jgi:hypothetical protein